MSRILTAEPHVEAQHSGEAAPAWSCLPAAFPTLIVEQSSECVAFADPDGMILYINPAGRKLVGLTPDQDVRGSLVTDYVAPEHRQMCLDIVLPTAKSIGFWQGEMNLLNQQTGAIIPVHRTLTALRDSAGGLLGYSAISHDISEQQRAARTLKEGEERLAAQFFELEALYRSAPVGLAVMDASFRYVRINEKLAEINGASVADHIGRRMHDVVPGLVDHAIGLLQQVLETGEPLFDIEIVGDTPAQPGVIRAWRENFVPLFARDGSVVGVSIAAIEITEMKRTADALAEKEAQLRTIMETVPVGIIFAEYPSGRIIEGNPQVAKLMRHPVLFSPDTDSYDEWISYHADGTRVNGHEYPLARMFRNGEESPDIEVHYQRGDGSRAWMRIMGRPVRDAQGKMVGGVVAIVDVDDQRRAEEGLRRLTIGLEQRVEQRTHALRKANKLLAAEIERREAAQSALVKSQKLEALGQLTSGVAHDFNNIIAAISGGFRVIERRTTDPDLIEIARHGASAAERGGALVAQLLSFARPQELSPDNIALADLLARTRPLLRQSVGLGVEMSFDVGPDVPLVRMDPVQLETALLNLAVNARDAMDGVGRLHFGAQFCPADAPGRPAELDGLDMVLLTVTDTGCGMAADVLERATEPFFTTKGAGHGTGLGLAMVNAYIRQSGGAMAIDSTPGKGTRFRLYLPLAPGAAVADGPLEPGNLELAPHPVCILLVDDDEAVRSVTAAMLSDLGHHVVMADSGARALDILAHDPAIQLVLSDIAMPDMDGTDLAAEIGRNWPHIAVLLFTGNADRPEEGHDMILGKPFSYEALSRQITARLRQTAERACHDG